MRVYSKRSRAYFANLDKVLPRVELNGSKDCPKCGGTLMRDGFDIFCLPCGWRESEYFGRSGAKINDLFALMFNNARYL